MGRVLVEGRAAGLGQRVRMLRLDQETAAQKNCVRFATLGILHYRGKWVESKERILWQSA